MQQTSWASERRLPFFIARLVSRRSEQRRQHPLETADEDVGLAVALKEGSDLYVFGLDLVARKIAVVMKLFDFPFEPRDMVRRFPFRCRGLSRLVGPCRG